MVGPLVWLFGHGYYRVLGILRSRYSDETQHAQQFMQHAQRMQYPQFREELLRIAGDESKYADWLAEKITQFGGSLPPVLQTLPDKTGRSPDFFGVGLHRYKLTLTIRLTLEDFVTHFESVGKGALWLRSS